MLVSTKWILLALTVAGALASPVGTVAIDLEVTDANTGAAVPLQAPGYRARSILLRYEADTLRIKTTLVADSTVNTTPRCD